MNKNCIRALRKWLIAIMIFCVAAGKVGAADAYFSPDGKTVTLLLPMFVVTSQTSKTVTPGALGRVNIETGVFTPIPLPKVFDDAEIDSIAAGAEGEILFLTKEAVWVIKGNEPPREVCKTTRLVNPTDLIVVTNSKSPLKDWLLVSATEEGAKPCKRDSERTLYARKPGEDEFQPIYCRRTPNVSYGAFASDGRIIFECENDVWAGEISGGVLNAARVAPLSTLSTNLANAGAMWVRDIATAGPWMYALLHGHHMGAAVRTPLPAPLSDEPTIAEQYRTMAECLAKAEEIEGSDEYTDHMCAWEQKGKARLFFTDRHNMILWTGHGESKVIGQLPDR